MPKRKSTTEKAVERLEESEREKQTEGEAAAERSVRDSDEDSKPVGGEDARTPHEGGSAER